MDAQFQNLLVARRLGDPSNVPMPSVKIDIPVTKNWNDNNNANQNRPNSITVRLYSNGSDTGKSLTLNASNNWKGTFTNLDDKSGYSVKEINVPAGYTASYSGNQSNGFVITNNLITTSVKVNKTWNDENNRDGKRPRNSTRKTICKWTRHWSKSNGKHRIFASMDIYIYKLT